MPDDFIYPRMPRKQIELWGIKSNSGNFRPYQIQIANNHFKDFQNTDSTTDLVQRLKKYGIHYTSKPRCYITAFITVTNRI